MNEVYTIYTLFSCHYCDKAKELLDEKGLEYEDVNALSYQELFIDNGYKTVPQIFKGTTYIGGYKELKEYLDT